MTNNELRQAIEDANRMVSQVSKDARNYSDLCAHLNALLAEQLRRATAATPVVAPSGPLWVQPVFVQPTWVPQPVWELTCGGIGRHADGTVG